MLTKKEFDILSYLTSKQTAITQRELSKATNMSLGTVNGTINRLIKNGLVSNNTITEAGVAALYPYKVENAIIMAAGTSSRFAPLSYEKPKGLLEVKGEILIERQIQQLHESGIKDITIVVGYMKEQFFYLEDKYNVNIVVNDDFYRYNNTSTLMLVAKKLGNTYICSSDNYFSINPFEKYVFNAYYASVFCEGDTDEYCLITDSHGLIKNVCIGGCNSWIMLGHVYFDKFFSNRFVDILQKEYSHLSTKEHLWEDLYIQHIADLNMYIKKYDSEEIFEFDTLDELRHFDEKYINNTDSSILKNIRSVLSENNEHVQDKDITDIVCIKEGLTNKSFYFKYKDEKYVYRHPGKNTEKYINRKSEAFSMKQAKELGLDDSFIYMDESEGWKLSKYIDNAKTLDYHNSAQVSSALDMMKKLHDANIKSPFDFDIWTKANVFIKKLKDQKKCDFQDFNLLEQGMNKVHKHVSDDNWEWKLCHCDCYSPNFILSEDNKMYLIDWEYSGNDDPSCDLGTFICCSDYSFEEALLILQQYYGRELSGTELRHSLAYIAIASYYWFVWALYQESIGNTVGSYLYLWYKSTKFYMKKSLELYERNENESE